MEFVLLECSPFRMTQSTVFKMLLNIHPSCGQKQCSSQEFVGCYIGFYAEFLCIYLNFRTSCETCGLLPLFKSFVAEFDQQ
jgi:hypothetical protein